MSIYRPTLTGFQRRFAAIGSDDGDDVLRWENPDSNPHWELQPDFSLVGLANTFSGFSFFVIPKFNAVGDYIEMKYGGIAYPRYRLIDADENMVEFHTNGYVGGSSSDAQYFGGWEAGDILRITRISATQFSRQINAGSVDLINQTFSGEVDSFLYGNTTEGQIFYNPQSNISF